MTLGRLALAWIVVAAWFEIAAYVTHYIVAKLVIPPGATVYTGIPFHLIKRRAVEAALVSLIASLWFDSLGSGEWWLVFTLVGVLATVPVQLLQTAGSERKWAFVVAEGGELLRYLGAGALLAWRLS